MLLKPQWSSRKAWPQSKGNQHSPVDLQTRYRRERSRISMARQWKGEKGAFPPLSFFILTPDATHCNSLCWKHHTRSFPPRSFQLNIATLEKPPYQPLPHLSSDHCVSVCFLEISLLWVCLKLIYQKFNLQVDDDGRWGSTNGPWVLRTEVS